MKQLRGRILGFFTLVLVLFTLLFIYLSSNILENQAVEQQGNDLEAQLLTLSSQVDETYGHDGSWEDLSAALDMTADAVSERITFISLTGEVVYDSRADQDTLENHLLRPEVQQVIEGEPIGTYSRESTSTGEYLYYVSVEISGSDGEPLGYLRLSKNVEEMAALTDEVIQILLLFMSVSILVALLFTYYWTKRIIAPLENMKQVTEHLSTKTYSSRYTARSYEEIDELGHSINTLAENLDRQMQEIEQNDAQLKELINHLVIGVLVIDKNRKISMVNPVMNQIPDEDLYAQIDQDYDSSLHSADLVELIERSFDKQQLQNKELTLYYPEDKIVDVNVVPIKDAASEPLNYIVLLYDITEIRRLEKVRTDFVANVSHELRTPITAIKGFTETLLDGAMNEEDVLLEFLQIINTESQRLDSMVQDILQLSKLEQRKVIGTVESVRVRNIVSEVERIVHQKIDLKSIHFDIIEKESVTVEIDRDQLKQILLNLISNAVSYTPEQGNVHVSIKDDGDHVLIAVADTGMGIAEEEQPRIFERFYRVDKARSRNAGGTGLGLSIVKWLVENNHGQLSLESKLGQGSTFFVRLPKTK